MGDLDRINLDCPADGCSAKIRTSLGEWSRGASVTCANGHTVELKDQDGSARRAKQALDDLDKTIRNFGR